jgi:hypothetical protein
MQSVTYMQFLRCNYAVKMRRNNRTTVWPPYFVYGVANGQHLARILPLLLDGNNERSGIVFVVIILVDNGDAKLRIREERRYSTRTTPTTTLQILTCAAAAAVNISNRTH